MKRNFHFYKQPDAKDWGSTCLRIIAKYYGKVICLQKIREFMETTRSGSNLQIILKYHNMELIICKPLIL